MELKVITYNIDGLPETLDLNDLPWIFKPLVWVYKKVKGTTIIKVNDNTGTSERVQNISKYLSSTGVDIVAVQEDFNYHDELMSYMPQFECTTYSGGFDLSKAFSSMTWFPYPRFKTDGLNLITKKNRVEVSNEEIISWKKSYGYFSHANDKLTHKGFRFYTVNVDGIDIDIYVLHMDADFYNPETCPNVEGDIEARKSQLQQLTKYIIEKESLKPSIIIGDTNSTERYEWDRRNINEYLIKPINAIEGLSIQEAVPYNYTDVDRVFYINNFNSRHSLRVKKCYYDLKQHWSDHFPLIAEFIVE